MIIYPHKRDDETEARKWRGPLFADTLTPLMWKEDGHYEMLKTPRSVTFPICAGCGHIIWDWPHFEEPVPDEACCNACAQEDQA